MILNQDFWNSKWEQQQTGWDLQQVAPPLKEYIDTLTDKNAFILIPGCGNAYEAEYLLQLGFKNVTLIDIAPKAVEILESKFKDTPIKVLHQDFFEHQGHYDLILEQTFFCAIPPELRPAYVQKMKALLKPNGILAGLLFNRSFEGGPPFGGSVQEYEVLFQPYCSEFSVTPCLNSIAPRLGTEVFLECQFKTE